MKENSDSIPESVEKILSVGDYKTQNALVKLWGFNESLHNLSEDDVYAAWAGKDIALKYRFYTVDHADEPIDCSNKQALQNLLNKIEDITIQ